MDSEMIPICASGSKAWLWGYNTNKYYQNTTVYVTKDGMLSDIIFYQDKILNLSVNWCNSDIKYLPNSDGASEGWWTLGSCSLSSHPNLRYFAILT